MPVKRLSEAKSRLEEYGDEARRALALAFAADVVAAAVPVATVLVVTDDDEAADELERLGARVEPDDPDAGLNPALSHGAELLRAARPGLGVATVSADLPALSAGDLRWLLASARSGRGFVPDLGGEGTTLLAAGSGTALDPRFGVRSRVAHLSSGATSSSHRARRGATWTRPRTWSAPWRWASAHALCWPPGRSASGWCRPPSRSGGPRAEPRTATTAWPWNCRGTACRTAAFGWFVLARG